MIIATHIDVAAPAEQVWTLVGPGFDDVGAWATVVARSESTPTGDGRRCSVNGVPGVDEVVERLTAYDETARTLTYVADTGLPGYVGHATNTWTVTPLGPDRSRVAVDARMRVSGPARLAAPLIRIALTAVGRRTLRDLKRHVESTAPAGNERRLRETTRRAGSGGDPPASDDGRLLATAISANAVFSVASGLVLVGGAVALAAPIGVPAWALAGIGAGVVGFGVLLLWLLTDSTRLVMAGRVAVAADLAWIAAAATVATIQSTMLATAGTATLGVLTAAVAAFATAQAIGLRRIRGASATGTTALAIRADRLLAASPVAVWDAVADASGYARFAAGIAATEVVSGAGEGMVRVCTDDRGDQWSETCTLWEPGRRYRMSVDVATYPPRYRALIDDLTQTWSVEHAPGGTLLTLTFDARVKVGIVGRLAARVLGRPARLDAILAAYVRELTGHAAPADAGAL